MNAAPTPHTDPTWGTPDPVAPDRRVKVVHLVVGLVLLGLVAVWALAELGWVSTRHLPLLGPAVLLLAGVAGLVGSLLNVSRGRAVITPGPAYGPAYDGPAYDGPARQPDEPLEDARDPAHDTPTEPTLPLTTTSHPHESEEDR